MLRSQEPYDITTISDSVRPYLIHRVKTARLLIAITFDDGPDPVYTPRILDLLKRHGDRATFFVTGQKVERFPQIAGRIAQEGHELGNHSYTHARLTRKSALAIRQEIERTEEILAGLTGQQPKLFRPPYGAVNKVVLEQAQARGYRVVLWSWTQDSNDWRDPGVAAIVRKVAGGAKPGDIVLMHDSGGNRRQTVEALAQILEQLHQRGYRFVTVSELLSQGQVADDDGGMTALP